MLKSIMYGKNLFMDVSEEKEVWTETIIAEGPE